MDRDELLEAIQAYAQSWADGKERMCPHSAVRCNLFNELDRWEHHVADEAKRITRPAVPEEGDARESGEIMSETKRYDYSRVAEMMTTNITGKFVLLIDYEKLRAENAELRAKLIADNAELEARHAVKIKALCEHIDHLQNDVSGLQGQLNLVSKMLEASQTECDELYHKLNYPED